MLSEADILHVDNHLLAVNKPAGLVTQPSPDHADSLEAQAKEWLREAFRKPGNVFLEAAHRIDRPVSGVVLFARTSKALSRLNQSVRERELRKLYWAVVEGSPNPAQGHLEHWLVHESHHARIVPPGTRNARLATLAYRVLQVFGQNALVEVLLHTGRYHQIRVQFAQAGHPVVGDTRYGARTSLPGSAIALHHRELSIEHPVTHQPLTLTAPCPEAEPWRRVAAQLPSGLRRPCS
jgi:23S rRNA pseudouridine1911/1915/1917 synthase